MSNKKFSALVTIMRAQIFHLGHEEIIREAREKADFVLIGVGSSHQSRDINNPFTYSERVEMITKVFNDDPRVVCFSVRDYPDDDIKWVSEVQKSVRNIAQRYSIDQKKIGLIGHSKDKSSYYLKIFPDWKNHVEVKNFRNINATDIRAMYFNEGYNNPKFQTYADTTVSKTTKEFLRKFSLSDAYKDLRDEYSEIQKYKDLFKDLKWPPIFTATDAVLTQSGYVLLIRRKNFPYKGMWALPGGYLEHDRMIVDNLMKELREETKVKVPEKVLRGSIKASRVFDGTKRDPRGRMISHAFHIDLGFPDEDLPKVKADSDAIEAKWWLISDIKQENLAFDHYHIINHFLDIE